MSYNGNKRPSREDRRAQRADRHAMTEEFFVCGIHPVEEALSMIPSQTLLKSKLYIAQTRQAKELACILASCERIGLKPAETSMQALSRIAGETRHQGVLLELPPFHYADLDDILDGEMHAQPLIVVLDQVQDPRNLGAIIRSAAAFGADALVIPRDRAAQMNAASLKTSAGQAYRLPICRVSNIAQTLRGLKERDFHIVGADIEGDALGSIDFHRASVIVMGSEGDGMRRLTRTHCDQMVRIPQNPSVESLNVSVAAAVILYSAQQKRDISWK